MPEYNREMPLVPLFDHKLWVDKQGNTLEPFRTITLKDFEGGEVRLSPDAERLTGKSLDQLSKDVGQYLRHLSSDDVWPKSE